MFRLILTVAVVGCAFCQPQLHNRGPHTSFKGFSSFPSNNNFNKFRSQPSFFVAPTPIVRASAEAVAGPFAPAPQNYDGRHYNHKTNDEGAAILRSTNDVNPDGSFQYSYETSNGIAAQAVGTPRNFGGNPPNVPTVIDGSFSWVAPDGTPVSISYIADENGYRAVGDAIPTPPPIPQAILRSLQYQGININKK